VLFTSLNTPITAILPLLSKIPDERVVLNSFRMVGGQIGVLLMNATALPLVGLLGAGDDHRGFFLTATIFGVLSVVMQFISFANIREVDDAKVEQEKSVPLKDSFKAMKGNWPWIIIVGVNLAFWIAMISRSVSLIYYLTYTMGHKELIPVMTSIGTVGMVMMIALPIICRHMLKRNAWILGLALSVVAQIMMYVVGDNIPLFIVFFILVCLGNAIANSLPFAMLGAAVDYGEWKTGVRSAGFLTAIGSSFCIKVGCGVGAAIPGYVMAYFGYVANQTQTPAALFGINFSFIWLPAIIFALAIIPLLFYKKFELMEDKIRTELAERNAAAE
jgi:sugar (glycoside-pentoside-hexuronide) transporter